MNYVNELITGLLIDLLLYKNLLFPTVYITVYIEVLFL